MSNNSNLNRAKVKKDDEWLTPRWMIAKVFDNVTTELQGKKVYCPCDGQDSEFTNYFTENFRRLGLSSLMCTKYNPGNKGELYSFDGSNTTNIRLEGDGDFRSPECCALRDEAEVVVTNPPWSIMREFLKFVRNTNYVFIGSIMTIIYKELWQGPRFYVLANNLHFETKTKKGNEPKGAIYSTINIPHIHPAGCFARAINESKGVMTKQGYIMFNKSDFVPTNVPLGTKYLVPVSTASMQRMYDAGYDICGYIVIPRDITGKAHFAKLLIEKVKEVDYEQQS